jgi:hypothetical protein
LVILIMELSPEGSHRGVWLSYFMSSLCCGADVSAPYPARNNDMKEQLPARIDHRPVTRQLTRSSITSPAMRRALGMPPV